MKRPRKTHCCLPFLVLLGIGCADRKGEDECFGVDPRGVWHVDDPGLTVETYCDRGAESVEGNYRLPIFHCVAKPSTGCDPCMLEPDEVDALLVEAFESRAEAAACPSDFAATQVRRGCFAELVETEQCCWTSEFFYDPEICDPGPQSIFP